MFGEFTCKIDSKGRMRLPKELLSQLTDGGGGTQALFLTRGFGKYLKLYTKAAFDARIARAKRLNPDNAKHYRLLQLLFQGAQEVKVDSADRINISKVLVELAGLHQEAIVSTFLDQVEIWSAEEYWKNALGADATEQDELTEAIFGPAELLPAAEATPTSADPQTETPPAG